MLSFGQKVYFGRTHGEKTLGEIVKVNRTRVKVKQLEARGTMRDYPVGTVWTVPFSLCSPADGAVAASAAPKVKRPEAEIMADIRSCYSGLSPENLYCDGECSRTLARAKERRLNARLNALFTELGRKVTEATAFNL